MSSNHLVTPDREIKLGENTFTLRGTFGVLRDLQHAFALDLLPLQASIVSMRQDQIARLIAIASGEPEAAVGQLLIDEMDVTGTEYRLLKAELLAWLAVAMTPKREREKKVREMAAILDRLIASPGGSTGNSRSANSGGRRKTSGKQPSGM